MNATSFSACRFFPRRVFALFLFLNFTMRCLLSFVTTTPATLPKLECFVYGRDRESPSGPDCLPYDNVTCNSVGDICESVRKRQAPNQFLAIKVVNRSGAKIVVWIFHLCLTHRAAGSEVGSWGISCDRDVKECETSKFGFLAGAGVHLKVFDGMKRKRARRSRPHFDVSASF